MFFCISTVRWLRLHCVVTNHYLQNCPLHPHAILVSSDGQRQANSQAPAEGNIKLGEEYATLDNQLAMPGTAQSLATRPAKFLYQCKLFGVTVVSRTVPTGAAKLNKPKPWTPNDCSINSALEECKL